MTTSDHQRQPRRPRLLVCLLGGRIQPAAMTAILTRPDMIACVVSADEPKTADHLLALLKSWNAGCVPLPTQVVSAASALAAEQAVESLIAANPYAKPIISLTGAPMPMGVGACTAARRAECPAYYLNTARRALVDLAHEDTAEPVDLRLRMGEFLHVHGLQMRRDDAGQIDKPLLPAYVLALALLTQDLSVACELQLWLAQINFNHRPWSRPWTLDDRHLYLLEQLAGLGLLSGFRTEQHAGECIVHAAVPDATHRKFLTGHWLEYYVYLVAQDLKHESAPLFDSMAHSLHMLSSDAEREIDFIGLRGSIPLIASCKTGANDSWEKSVLDEVVTVGKNLGDNYCTKLYVTSRSAPHVGPTRNMQAVQFREQAHNAKVVVVTGDELPDLDKILLREATTPTYTRL